MAYQPLGKIAMTPKGEWNSSDSYQQLDVVTSNGSVYISVQDINPGESAPNMNNEKWQKLLDTSEITGNVNTKLSQINALISDIDFKQDQLNNTIAIIKNLYGAPTTAYSINDMQDTKKVYIYVGNESGYESGHWYYYDNGEWIDGGIYNSPVDDGTMYNYEYPYDNVGSRVGNKGATVTTTSFYTDNSLPLPPRDMMIFGKSIQNIGKNLLPYESPLPQTESGVTISVENNGGLHIVGTSTSSISYRFHNNHSILNVPEGKYNLLLTGNGTGFENLQLGLTLISGRDGGMVMELPSSNPITVDYTRTVSYVSLMIAPNKTYDCTIYPMLTLSSESDTSFEPYVGGIPSPYSPQEITNVGDEGAIKINVRSKNLLQYENGEVIINPSAVNTYVRVTPLPDGGLHIAGFVAGGSTEQGVAGYPFHKNYVDNNCILNVPPGVYQFALFGSGQGFENLLIQMYSSTSDSGSLSSKFWTNGNDGSKQQEIDNTIKRNYLRLRMTGDVSVGTTYNCVVYPMMMQVSEASSNVKFMPYENTTINIPITNGLSGIQCDNTEYFNNSNFFENYASDFIDFKRKKLVQCIRTVTLDGTFNNYTVVQTTNDNIKRLNISQSYPALTNGRSDTIKPVLCNRLLGNIATSGSGTYGGHPGVSIDKDGVCHICFGNSVQATTKEEFQTWFTAHPTIVKYILANPIEINLTESQLTALKSIVMPTTEGRVSTLGTILPDIYIQYYQSLKNILGNLQNQIGKLSN